MQEMCETIVRSGLLAKEDGTAPTSEEIFKYSPTGELSKIWDWYKYAKVLLGEGVFCEQCQSAESHTAEFLFKICDKCQGKGFIEVTTRADVKKTEKSIHSSEPM